MTTGRLIAVVGPSGVGKDSVMAGIAAARPSVRYVQRTITRASDLGGEDYHAVTTDTFDRLTEEGAFCIWWGAHGLLYGVPSDVLSDTKNGETCMVNFSRAALTQASGIFPRMTVLNITADTDVLAQRLTARGREPVQDIEKRLKKAAAPLPEGLDVITVSNNGALTETIDAALAALEPLEV